MQTTLENVNGKAAEDVPHLTQSTSAAIESAQGSTPAPCAKASRKRVHRGTVLGKAGSDDASEFSVAPAASLASTACADRPACAALAEPACDGRSRAAGAASGTVAASSSRHGFADATAAFADAAGAGPSPSGRKPGADAASSTDTQPAAAPSNRFAAVPPGRKRLPVDGEAFVNAVHRQVDLVQMEVTLLRDPDNRIVQRELAYLRELRYGKRAPDGESEPRTIIFDAPQPEGE